MNSEFENTVVGQGCDVIFFSLLGSSKLHQGERRLAGPVNRRAHPPRSRNEGPGLQEVSRTVSGMVLSGWLDGLLQVIQILIGNQNWRGSQRH
jgi:hypothetical protein